MENSKGKRQRTASVGLRVAIIGGAGHAGLPLSLVLAERGHSAVVIDRDSIRIREILQGRFPFLEAKGPELLARCLAEFPERFHITCDYSTVRQCDAIVIAIATPVDEHLNPQFRVIEACLASLKPHLRDGQTFILRSTVFPGTSARILTAFRSWKLNVAVSVCPECLATGHAIEELTTVPQIISGSSAEGLRCARALFAPFNIDMLELCLAEAEVAKLFLNAWRYVVLGTANQFFQIAMSKDLNFHRIRTAIMHRYGRAAGFPCAGFTAGPHLLRDTLQLAACCRHTFSLGHAAMLVNETMPDCILDEARRDLARSGRTLAGLKCGILGMAFKPDSDDVRESLAFKLRRLLLWEGAQVLCSDVHMQCQDFVDAKHLMLESEIVFIGCPHHEYRHLELQCGQKVFDCWGCLPGPKLSITSKADVNHKHESKALRVAVVGGAGHVGLPLSLVLAECGHSVLVVDTSESSLSAIRQGCFPFLEAGGPELLQRCLAEFPERFVLTSNYSAAQGCDVVVVTIGTPVDEHLNPNFSVIEACVKDLSPFLEQNQTLVLRSTLFPGTSTRVLSALKEEGLDVGVSFCPERIAQGQALEELRCLPQIISGSDAHALSNASALFAPLGVDLVELELQEAEAAKLFLNAWRYVVFGTANQFYHIASSRGLDFDRICTAIKHKNPRAATFPRSGFTAGPCLFKDTMQLAAYCRHTFSLGHAAMLVNETMPDCVVEQAKKELSHAGRKLRGARCGILGMAFKPNNDDIRESLAFKLRRLLVWEGAIVLCSDIYVQRDGFVSTEQLLEQSDILFIGCPHREYQDLIFRAEQLVFDCWGSTSKPAKTAPLVHTASGDDDASESTGRP